tara:strand:- start:11742 stop:12548 length:807 start_codon:yes stop_codon:yes gene_type:complete
MTKNPFNKLKLPELDGPSFLYFGLNNAKLPKNTAAFSLPAGYTCPGACDCLAHFDREEGKLIDGPKSKFRCFAASLEAAFPNVRKSVDRNLAILKDARTTERMADVIELSLPPRLFENIRVHADGDFYNQSYFLAWMEVARRNPSRLFYAYTKNLPVWVKFKKTVPENFALTASRGGKWDSMIEPNNLRSTTVVYHPDEAHALGLEIDHDDGLARDPNAGDFALLIHGVGAKGSKHSAAIKRLKSEGVEFSYGKAATARREKLARAAK